MRSTNSNLAGYYSLSGGTRIPDGADLQNYKTPGNYYVPSSASAQTIKNCPITRAFTLKIEYATGNAYPIQTVRDYGNKKEYCNMFDTDKNAWNGWTYRVMSDDNDGICMRMFSMVPRLSTDSDRFTITLPSGIDKSKVRGILACNRNETTNEAYIITCKQIANKDWQAIGNAAGKWITNIQFIAFYAP